MKFAQSGYYIEKYVKCVNCGVLIYENSATSGKASNASYCTQWCIEWAKQKEQGIENPTVSVGFND